MFAGHEGFVREVGRRELLLSCQHVIGGGDDDMRMLAERTHLDIDAGRRLPHHGDVEIIAAQGVANGLAVADCKRDVDLWKTPRKAGDRERHEVFRRAHGADRDSATGPPRDHIERLLAVEQGSFETFAERENEASRVGQRHAFSGPLDQRQACQYLQVAQLKRDRGLGQVEPVRGGRDRAGFLHGRERAKLADGQVP